VALDGAPEAAAELHDSHTARARDQQGTDERRDQDRYCLGDVAVEAEQMHRDAAVVLRDEVDQRDGQYGGPTLPNTELLRAG
jgi:hypothetical protein